MSIKSKIALLDRVFSQYIRLRDTDTGGFGRCISCGAYHHYTDLDAGHFVNRKHKSLRYNEVNVNIQCIKCNRFDEGNASGYSLGLIIKYHTDIISQLNISKNKTVKFTEFELSEMIKMYRIMNKQLAKDKTFKINLA